MDEPTGEPMDEPADEPAGGPAGSRGDEPSDDSDGDAADGDAELDAGPAGQGGAVVRYDGEDWIEGVPTRDDIVAEQDAGGVTATIGRHLAGAKPVFFMPCDIEETNEYANGLPVYTLRIFGATMDGAKADVVITGVKVFFDVPAGPDAHFDARLRHVLSDAGATGLTIEAIEALPSRGYNTGPKPYRRVHAPNLQLRKKAIAAVRAAGMETASDDRTCYYRKAARECGFPLSDWAVLSGYEYTAGPTERSPLCAHTFRVPAEGYRPLVDTMAAKEKREAAANTKAATPLLAKDRLLVVTWDIETHSGRGAGDVPAAEHDEDHCFMICMTAHWKDDPAPMRRVCIVDVAAAPDPRWTTVICGTPANVLKAFALCWRALAPDVAAGFNDSNYDWPFVVEKARRLNTLGWMFNQMSAAPRRAVTDEAVLRWSYQHEKKIKITAEEVFFSSYLKVPGCIPIDVRVCYKKLYPKSETPKAGSLKFYLEVSGLAGKADMPVRRMWAFYEAALAAPGEGTAERMRQVGNYCVVDAQRCQELLVRRNIINDYREVSSLAFVSLLDSVLYAGGMKVCNLLGAYAAQRGIAVSMIPLEREENGKYPGAYVFQPEKGIVPDPDRRAAFEAAAAALREAEREDHREALTAARAGLARARAGLARDRPVTGLDFASLYPSLIMTYNLSPEKILLTAEDAAHWRAQGRRLHPIEFPFNGRTVRGWSVLHEGRPEELGLYPSVLVDLFAKRAEMKASLGVHGAEKELLELVFGRARRDGSSVAAALRAVLEEARVECGRTAAALAPGAPPPGVSPGSTPAEEVADLRRLDRNARERLAGAERLLACAGAADDEGVGAAARAEYERVCFAWTCANTKQNALKVYMNTFYGEAGNSLSPFFLLQLAGGVTSAGQHNIKLVADFVRSRGFHIKYGDTDSLYLVAPDECFVGCDAEYAAGRASCEEWMTAQVRITMRALNQVRDEVNAHLRADNGGPFLKMAYEEVLFPAVFTGKKKYFGIPHLNEVNFRPDKLFIRGIDVVKQGQPGLAREIGHRIMWACMALDNRRGVRQIVEDALRDAVVNGAQWNFDHFVKTDAWKPNKNNQPVHRFMARMRGRRAIEVAENARAGAAPRPPLYELPEPGERFSYVIVATGASFDLHGHKSALKKGDRMEFAAAARAQALDVDVAYYMVSYVVGLCARFINGDAAFQPPANARLTEKNIDELSQKAAKKALELFIKDLGDVDSGTLRRRGWAYRRAFTRAAADARDTLAARVGPGAAEVLVGDWLDFETFAADEESAGARDGVSAVVEALWARAGACAAALDGGDAWCEALGRALGIDAAGADVGAGAPAKPPAGAPAKPPAGVPAKPPAGNLFRATAARPPLSYAAQAWASTLDRLEAETRGAFAAAAPGVADIAARYEAGLSRLVFRRRRDEHASRPDLGAPDPDAGAPDADAGAPDADAAELLGVTEDDRAPLLAFRRTWFTAVGLWLTRRRADAYAGHLRRLKDRRLGVAAAPARAERDRAIAAAAAKLRTCGDIAL